jgi:hypothetical protein
MFSRFQFRLRTLLIVVAAVAVIASVASRIAYEQRLREVIVGKWVCDIYGHKNGYSVIFSSKGRVNMGVNLPNPPLDRVGGGYSYNTADRTVEIEVIADTGGREMERFTHHGRLMDDDSLILDEDRGPKATLRLKRDTVGVWATK